MAVSVRERLLDDSVGGERDADGNRSRASRCPSAERRGRGSTSRARRGRTASAPSARCPPSLASRSTPRIWRSSPIVWRPVSSMLPSSVSAASGSRRRLRRAADAWITITLTEWATMSCSSRAMRVRSSVTRRLASSSRSRSARSARSRELGDLGPPAPHVVADDEGGDQPDQRAERDPDGEVVAILEQADHQEDAHGGEQHADGPQPRRAVGPRAERVERERHRDPARPVDLEHLEERLQSEDRECHGGSRGCAARQRDATATNTSGTVHNVGVAVHVPVDGLLGEVDDETERSRCRGRARRRRRSGARRIQRTTDHSRNGRMVRRYRRRGAPVVRPQWDGRPPEG